MASQRQAHNRKRQKAILVMAVALLIIVVIAIIGLTTFLKKYSASKEVTDYSKYYKLEQEDEMFVVFDNEKMEQKAILQNDEVYMDYRIVRLSLRSHCFLIFFCIYYQISSEKVSEYVCRLQSLCNQYT